VLTCFVKDILTPSEASHILCCQMNFCQCPSLYWCLFYCICSHALFGFSSKAEAWQAKKERQGAKAPRKTGTMRTPHSASVSVHGRRSMKVMANQVLIEVGAGASDKLPLIGRQSFKDGRYSPSTRMEGIEWQIML
jgi:hypothetical protein